MRFSKEDSGELDFSRASNGFSGIVHRRNIRRWVFYIKFDREAN